MSSLNSNVLQKILVFLFFLSHAIFVERGEKHYLGRKNYPKQFLICFPRQVLLSNKIFEITFFLEQQKIPKRFIPKSRFFFCHHKPMLPQQVNEKSEKTILSFGKINYKENRCFCFEKLIVNFALFFLNKKKTKKQINKRIC